MENSFYVEPEIRWADLDPNFHVLHSRYYDYAAFCRTKFLVEKGLTPEVMTAHYLGPVLFKESCTFRKELRFGDHVKVDLELSKMMMDHSRWKIRHKIIKNNEFLAATIEVDIAWIDTRQRKLIVPPSIVAEVADAIPRSTDFEMVSRKADFQ